MNQKSKDARTKLKMSTRREFEALVYESLLTPLQERIVRLHIAEGVPVPIIANNEAQTANLLQRLNPAPIPAYPVQNPNCCGNMNFGCGCA